MKQLTIKARVRPARVAVLIPTDATNEEVLLAVRFLSRIWGGVFSPLLSVERDKPDTLNLFRLSNQKPDYIYGINVDKEVWGPKIAEAAQPRGFGPLTSEFADNLHEFHSEDFITVGHVVTEKRDAVANPKSRARPLRLVHCDLSNPLAPIVAAQFGIPYGKFDQFIPNLPTSISAEAQYVEVLRAIIRTVTDFEETWLDLGSHRLAAINNSGMEPPPTIVLVGETSRDLSWFWNARCGSAGDTPAWLLPVPAHSATDPVVLSLIRDWLLAFDAYRTMSNYAEVSSVSVPLAELDCFASKLKTELNGTHFEFIRVVQPPKRYPVVVPYEVEELISADRRSRQLRFRAPRPKLLENRLNASWMVDLLEDDSTRRSVNELCLPNRISTLHVLNAFGPKRIRHYRLPPIGDGPDGISIHCHSRDDYVDISLPTAQEILEEVLREHSVEPTPDEKRPCYAASIRLMGGLERSAKFMSGTTRNILLELAHATLTVGELSGRCQLGDGKLPEFKQIDWLETAFQRLPPAGQRVSMRRFRNAAGRRGPKAHVKSLLEFWADRGIVAREWRLGPCPTCLTAYWSKQVDISSPVRCPGCNRRLQLTEGLRFGYSLHPLIKKALAEGLPCVVLTARFLASLTSRGFLWLPGCKYRRGEKNGDLDVVASCDGHLVFAECKTRCESDISKIDWKSAFAQFEETIATAEACRAGIVVYSSLVESYPEDFVKAVGERVKPPLTSLLLTKTDLDQGFKRHKLGNHFTLLRIQDCIFDEMPEEPPPPFEIPGEIKTPYWTRTIGKPLDANSASSIPEEPNSSEDGGEHP